MVPTGASVRGRAPPTTRTTRPTAPNALRRYDRRRPDAVAESNLQIIYLSSRPEWEEAGIEVPILSSYSDNDAKQEKRHGHSAMIGKKQKVFEFFLSSYVDDAAFILLNRDRKNVNANNNNHQSIAVGIPMPNRSSSARSMLQSTRS